MSIQIYFRIRILPRLLAYFFLTLGFPFLLRGQYAAGIDTVFSFIPGKGQNSGQNAPYFPRNIFGLPDTSARDDIAVVSPEAVCSLGMGGEIIIGWKNSVLLNKAGADFIIFENAFRYGNGRIFAEPAEVSVSRDGVHFVRFPFDSLSLRGCAGITPTNGNRNPFNPAESGGDAFDLEEIGMDSVRFIKITDVTHIPRNNPAHPFWDPTLSGFDLDALVGLHLVGILPKTLLTHGKTMRLESDDGSRLLVTFLYDEPVHSATCWLVSANGSTVISAQICDNQAEFSIATLAHGLYFVVFPSESGITAQKFFR